MRFPLLLPVVVFWVGVVPSAWGQAQSPEAVITRIKEAENELINRVGIVRWKSNYCLGKYTNTSFDDGSRLTLEDLRDTKLPKSVTFDPKTGRFHYEWSGVIGWIDGPTDQVTMREVYSYDGEKAQIYSVSNQGAVSKIAEGTIGSGHIQHTFEDHFWKNNLIASGMGLFPPYFVGERLSQYLDRQLRAGNKLEITVTDDRAEILTSAPKRAGRGNARIVFDFRIGGITQIDMIVGEDAPIKEDIGKCYQKYEIEWSPIPINGEEVLLPSVILSALLTSNQNANRFTFEDYEINISDDPSRFDIDFPVGTRMVDEVNKMVYVVSEGAIDEQAAMREFMEAENLRHPSEVESEEKPRHEEAEETPTERSYLYWLLGGVLAVLVLLGIVFWLRRHRAAVIGCLALLLPISAYSQALKVDERGTWWTTASNGYRGIPVRQCGFRSTLFTLEYFGVRYDLKHVSASLPPTGCGIDNDDLLAIIRSHGLEVSTQDEVPFDEFCSTITPGTLAIVPVKAAPPFNQYLVVLNHPERGLLLVEPPKSILRLPEDFNEEILSNHAGPVLFVSKPAHAKRMNRCVVIEPHNLELGEFPESHNYDTWLPRTITLRNISEEPLSLARIFPPCATVMIDERAVLIPAKSSVDLELKIYLRAWEPDPSPKEMIFQFPDGSETKYIISAKVQLPQRRELRFEFAPNPVRIVSRGGARSRFLIRYQGSLPYDLSEITCKSNQPWLLVSGPKVDGRSAEVVLHIKRDELPSDVLLPIYAEVGLANPEGKTIGEVRVIFDQ